MQALESGRRGGDFGLLYYKDAQYVMAVLADEIFIALDWPGREAWKNDLLETRLFGSYNAGDQFFQRLEALLAQGDRAQPELALVYLQALGLGFKGRFRGMALTPKLDDYRRRLFEYVYRKRPDLGDPARVLSPQAYRHTVAEATPRLLPDPRLWLWVLGGVFVTFLIVAHVLWTSYTAELRALLAMGG
jgi:type VI secretion system protein ImpK